MIEPLSGSCLISGAVVRDYHFTSVQYAAFICQLRDRKIDFVVLQVGPDDYYRFLFRLDGCPWYNPIGSTAVNVDPLHLA